MLLLLKISGGGGDPDPWTPLSYGLGYNIILSSVFVAVHSPHGSKIDPEPLDFGHPMKIGKFGAHAYVTMRQKYVVFILFDVMVVLIKASLSLHSNFY
jgi:hypothetical protein